MEQAHPLIFSGPMVRAILEGRKTMTRRVLKPQPTRIINDWTWSAEPGELVIYNGWPHRLRESRGRNKAASGELTPEKVRLYQPGDLIWVKETWFEWCEFDPPCECPNREKHIVQFRADTTDRWPAGWGDADDEERKEHGIRWGSPIFMPRWASRITLKVTSTRIERVQEIGNGDAKAEGITPGYRTYRDLFRSLWNSLYAKKPENQWDANPWVVVIEFERSG